MLFYALYLRAVVTERLFKKIGNIIDVSIDEKGNMVALIIQKSKFLNNIFSSQNEIEIKWSQVKKIGEDVILVNMIISWYNFFKVV